MSRGKRSWVVSQFENCSFVLVMGERSLNDPANLGPPRRAAFACVGVGSGSAKRVESIPRMSRRPCREFFRGSLLRQLKLMQEECQRLASRVLGSRAFRHVQTSSNHRRTRSLLSWRIVYLAKIGRTVSQRVGGVPRRIETIELSNGRDAEMEAVARKRRMD
jgi:hypothetical protein